MSAPVPAAPAAGPEAQSRVSLRRDEPPPRLALDLGAGEAGILTGPGGSGKSTVLRAAVGLARPPGLRALVAGFDLGAVPHAIRRRVLRDQRLLFLPQEPVLVSNLSVLENLLLPVGMLGERPTGAAAGEACEALRRLGLSEAARARPATLPAADRRLIVLLRGFLRAPRTALLDEPLLGLGRERRAGVLDLLRAAVAGGCAILVACRDPRPFADLGPRLVTLGAGTGVEERT